MLKSTLHANKLLNIILRQAARNPLIFLLISLLSENIFLSWLKHWLKTFTVFPGRLMLNEDSQALGDLSIHMSAEILPA